MNLETWLLVILNRENDLTKSRGAIKDFGGR